MIFVDTGAWYALATASDPDHARATGFVASNGEPFLTSDYIVDELLTLFAVRGQKAKGIEWRTDVLDRDGARLVRVVKTTFPTRFASTRDIRTKTGALPTAPATS